MSNREQNSCKVRTIAAGLCLACATAWAGGADHGKGHHGHAAEHKPQAAKPARGQELPSLRIVSPKEGARAGRTLSVDFETPADLSKMTMSAKEIGAHLHIDLDGLSLMPAQSDLKPLGANRYRYTFDLPALPGTRVIKVYWSDAAHKTIESTVQQVTVTVVDDGAGGKR